MAAKNGFTRERKHYLAARLAAGTCTQAERDEAMAMMLWCLWEDAELKDFVERIQDERCRNCRRGNLWSMLLKNWPALVVLAFLVLALVIANLTGTDVSPVFGK